MPSEPAATFPQRCCAAVAAAAAAGRPFDAVYVSQTAFLTQRTLVPDIPALVRGLRAAAAASREGGAQGGADCSPAEEPLIIIDGEFAALRAPISSRAGFLLCIFRLCLPILALFFCGAAAADGRLPPDPSCACRLPRLLRCAHQPGGSRARLLLRCRAAEACRWAW